MRKVSLLTLCLLFCSVLSLRAQDTTATATEDEGKLTITGYLDNYYVKNLNNPLSGSNAPNSGFERIFDQKEGQFQLGLIQTKFMYTNSRSEVVADLTFGPNADLGNYGNYNSLNPLTTAINGSDITSTALIIKQAYWTYKFTDKFSFTAGQCGTDIGYEVIDAPVNFNYSLSNLFGNGPFYHLGVKANYAFSDKIGLMAGLVNNWDSNFDNNRYKTAIGQLFIQPIDGWNIYINYIGGNEDTPTPRFGAPVGFTSKDSVQSRRYLFDVTTGYQITDAFYVGLNYAYGFKTKQAAPTAADPERTEPKPWGGIALYSNYAFTDMFAFGVRGEYFDNTQGVQYLVNNRAGAGTDVVSLTGTASITLAGGHLILKPEVRFDKYKSFTVPAGVTEIQQLEDSKGDFTKDSQTTIGIAGIYKF